MLTRAYGNGGGKGGDVSYRYFIKKDGTPAVFRNTADRDSYFSTNPDELRKIANHPVGIGTVNSITAAYVYDKGKKSWFPIATNFKGDPGPKGKPAPGLDLSALSDGEIPKWDSASQTLVPSGVDSPSDGELLIAPSSILFGNQSMSSTIDNVAFTNRHSSKIYAPVWQEIGAGKAAAFIRAYDVTVEDVVRVPSGGFDVTNPVNRNIHIDKDEVFYGGELTLSSAVTDLVIEVYDTVHKNRVWRQLLGDRPAGEVTVKFQVPFDVRTGYTYDIKLLSLDGSDVIAKSNSRTGFSWTIQRSTWEDIEVATQKWVKENYQSGGKVQIPPLTADMVTKAIDHGVATNGASMKSLADGWWVVPASLTGITGRPSGSQGDLIYFRQYVGGPYGVGMVFGKDRSGAATMWVQYKDGTKWTRWLPITGSEDLALIQSDINSLKLGDAAAVSRIERLETQVGKIYAPTKLLFDEEVNDLIAASLAAYVPPTDPDIAQLKSDLAALRSAAITVDQVESALKAKGWGPLSGGSAPSGGTDIPSDSYPQIVTMFTNSIPTSLTANSPVTSDTGKATLTRTESTATRLWVLVENDNDEADKVKGISINKGMEAVWASRDIVIGGKKYRAFYSAGAYTETTVDVQVNFKE